jgi:H-type lectin domain
MLICTDRAILISALGMLLMPNMVSAQAPCTTTVSCAQVAVDVAAKQQGIVESLTKRIEELEKINSHIETGTIEIKADGSSGLRANFSVPFKNIPKVFASVTGVSAYDLNTTSGVHFQFNAQIQKVDTTGIDFAPATPPGMKINSVTVSWEAMGQ